MKKLVLLIAIAAFTFSALHAQVSEAERNTALQLVNQNRTAIGLSADDVANSIVVNTYMITGTDIRMVYLQQSYQGLPVYNQIHVLAFKNGKAVSIAGERIEYMEAKTEGRPASPAIDAAQALRTALNDRLGYAPPQIQAPEMLAAHKLSFGKLGITHENITAELMWYPDENEKTVRLAWQLFIAPNTSSDYWLVRVDAHTNKVIGLSNLTVYCDWNKEGHSIEDHINEKHETGYKSRTVDLNYIFKKEEKANRWQYRGPFVVNNAVYRVVKYPAESPQHPGGTPTTHLNPWTWAPGNATTLGWHSIDGINFFDSTRGNNVWAVEDRDGNNIPGLGAVSTTPQPDLSFDFVPDFTVDPTQRSPVPNQQFNTTNLFYWNNLVHDITYVYGFDEPSGNFQVNNLGRGGLGNDHVNADAQNPGNCNANFSTPVDGTPGRMQMFLCTNTTPPRDGDVDNLVIVHEYGHGVSNRLTGGPNTVTCLGNSEQGGEGWSDYYGLMLTHDWATALPTDGFNNPRGVGTYLFGQPPNGAGIRPTRYSTNFAVNPTTYANLPGQAVPHGVGYVWCTMLWEMTWEIIQQAGISPNLFDPTATGGNVIALKLVQEGMRLQPCSPGFVQARDAILRADTLFYGAQYSCAIWKAFARRGLGRNASQGLATSITDGVPDFTVDDGAMSLTQNSPQIPELQNIVYTNTVKAGQCTPMTNFFTTDTLPTHVTWVSGGTYNPVNRTVTFSGITLSPGQTQQNTFTVNINAGAYFAPITHINDPVTAIAPNWTATSTTSNVWTTSGVSVRSAPLAFFTPNAAVTSDQILRTTNPILIPSNPSARTVFSFWHRYITEAGWDGCVVEISTDGGTTWTDLDPYMSGARYNATLNSSPNPLSGRRAFSGNVGASFVQTRIDLSSFAGQSVLIRFRLGSDNLVSATGWYVDDILMTSEPFVYMKTNLFNSSGVLQNTRDTLTAILPANACLPGITDHPRDTTVCAGGNASFSVVATGIPVTYQWQRSTDGGTTWANISGATAATYTITGVTLAMNGYRFRCEVTGTCDIDTSNAAVLTVNPTPTHTAVAATPAAMCTSTTGSTVITGTATGGTVGSVTLGSSGTINLSIPDNNSTGISSNINLGSGTFTQASNLQIRLNMNHTWVGDLSVTLTSPCGTTYVFDRPGVPQSTFGNSADLNGIYIFDINAATIIPESGGGVIAPGNYRPSDNSNPGAAHNWSGITFPCNAAGTWTLTVSDNAGGDVGTLNEWAILMSSGVYTHSLSGPGTIVQNPPSGPNNANASFNVTDIPPGIHVYTLTSTDALGCSAVSTVNVEVSQTPVINVNPTSATICAGNIVPISVSTGVTRTFSSNVPISIPSSGPATPYPATINVSGLPTSGVTVKSVTINGVVHTFPDDIDILLQSPTGINVVLMSDVGGSVDNTGENYTFDDSAPTLMADATLNPSGTYRPTNYGATDTWVAPGPGSVTQATPAISMFGSGDMNGTWRLFVVDDLAGDLGSIASWSITFNLAGAVFSPTAGLFTDAAATVPYTGTPVHGTIYASPAATTTYTVNAANGSCAATPVNVTITVNPNPTHSNVVANPALICTSTTGTTTITGTASGGTVSGVQISSGTINLAIPDNVPAGVNSNITLPSGTTITSAGDLSVRLNIAHTWVGDLRVTLTGPCGTTFVFDRPGVPQSTFGNSADLNGIYVFTLSAASIIPETGGGPVIPPGNYLPSNNANPGVAHNWAGITFPCNAAGTWTLNVSDNAGGDLGTLFEWAILLSGNYTHTLTGPGTITQNPPSGPNNANASFNVTNIPVGVHTYTLTATDAVGCQVSSNVTVTVGQNPNVIVVPPSATICQGNSVTLRVDTSRVFTNSVPMNIPGSGTGATTGAPASVYPSTINVSGLPTTGVRVKSVTISGISHTFPDDIDMLLQSPSGTNVILMSDVGGTNDFINNTFVFDDAAANLMSDAGANPSGTYRPTNYGTPDAFPAPGPGSITQATPALSMFGTGNLNGTWNLFVVDDLGGDVGTMQGWSITFDLVGVGPVTYSWSPAAGLNTTTGPVVIATPATTTTYTATATTTLGCTGSASSTITVITTTITSQPTSIAACVGETRTFVVVATGLNLSYQWQISTDGGATWTNIAGAIFPNLTLTSLTAAMNGNQYRCIISGCGSPVTSNAATLTVYNPVVITTQPANATVCAGANVTFTVAATGTPTPLNYQWQVSTNGGVTYTNIAGANNTSLTLTNVTTALNQNRYRCVVTGYCGAVASNAAILTVNGVTPVAVVALPPRICLSDTLIALSGSPVGGVWSGVGVIGNNFLPIRTAVGTYTLTYTFTNASGCTSTATLTAKVEDCPERRRLLRDDAVIVYPNPNNGAFNIRINSTLYSYLAMKVYAANGALVHTQSFNGLQYGRVIPIDLRKLAAGVYNVKIYYDDGVRTSEKTFKVIIGAH